MKILVMNGGSSSQKSTLYDVKDPLTVQPPPPLWEGSADWAEHQGEADLKITTAKGEKVEKKLSTSSRHEVIAALLETLWSGPTRVIDIPSDIAIVGNRIVHGGDKYRESVVITSEVKDTIRRIADFAPLHNPVNLEGIEAVQHILPHVKQVAVFDTAFHCNLSLANAVYPGPYAWLEQGIRRYGFHGISYQYCTRRTAQLLGREPESLRMVICHLGNGCSLAAIRDGHSIDTTMGFTPLEGLMMGSRSGSVDPGILIYLARQQGDSPDKLETMLNKESGLKGISGISSDMRDVLQARDEGNERAKLAVDIYVHRLHSLIGAMIASLGGIDVLVFTGGVGEHSAEIRASTCAAFGFLNLKLDVEKNQGSPMDQDIATGASSVHVLVVHTEENWVIAQECWRFAT
ncbi:MAG TPA: acetate kinase [Ktedonobacteraceae bacterium]|nr:acetate kinase [Ktedonobacteraceae bacterium]